MRSPRAFRDRLRPALAAVALAGVVCSTASAAVDRAAPLQVPQGPPAGPERWLDLGAEARLRAAATDWRLHGYRELPILAWAALGIAERDGRPDLAKLATEWAPESPGVQAEAARLTRSPEILAHALAAIPGSFPALLWLATLGLAALGLGAFVVSAVVSVLVFVRSLPRLGHSIGHLWSSCPSGSWPGALALGCVIAVVPLLGGGPLIVAAVLAAASVPYLSRVAAGAVVAMLLIAGLAVGPVLEGWSSLASVPASSSRLLAAWRLERGQALPADMAFLEERNARGEATPLERIALGRALTRLGDLDRAEAVVAGPPRIAGGELGASAATLLGSIRLARGDVRRAIESFSEARGYGESAPTLYNLSQAHGRALNLTEQSRLFSAARARNANLVSRAAAAAEPSLHRFLLEVPVPVRVYLSEALRGGAEAEFLARDVRMRALGARAPTWTWILLPGLAALMLLVQQRNVHSCRACLRVICLRCGTGTKGIATCVRCRRLVESEEGVDPRMRRRERDRDRMRRALTSRTLALLALALPGSAHVLEGRAWTGVLALLAGAVGAATLLCSKTLIGPLEVGSLGWALPLGIGLLLLGPAYLLGLVGSVSHLAGRRGP